MTTTQHGMHKLGRHHGIAHQKGVSTLATTTLLLIGITLMTLHANRMGSLELNMSNNYESRKTAFNMAESGLDALFENNGYIITFNEPVGYVYCTTADSRFSNCDASTIDSSVGWPTELADGRNQAQILMEGTGCPPRSMSTSCSSTIFSHFVARSTYDDTANKGGRAETVVGAMQLLPAFQ